MFKPKNKFKEKVKEITDVFHNRPEATYSEAFMWHEKSSDEMEAEEVQVKLEAIRMVLESCIDKPGHFQVEKAQFLKDFVISLGFDIIGNYAEDIWSKDGAVFRVFTTENSEIKDAELAAQGERFVCRFLMQYTYEEIRVSADTVKPVFRMDRLLCEEREPINKKKVVK